MQALWKWVDGIVKAWYWAQNKLGAISDEQYKQNLARIDAEKQARIKAIKDTASEMAKEFNKVKSGPGTACKMEGRFGGCRRRCNTITPRYDAYTICSTNDIVTAGIAANRSY